MTSQTGMPPAQRPRAARRAFPGIRAVIALILREMSTSYGRSPGGYLWAVLEPVGAIALLSAVFAAGFRAPALGISFPIYFATGMLPFQMFAGIHGKVAGALNYSRPLLAYPTVTFVDALLARFILDMMTKLLIGYLVLAGCMILFETRVTPNLPIIIVDYAVSAFLGLGIGTLNCFLFMRFNLWQRAWSILMRPMFIISGVLFLYDTIPQPYRDYLWYNPLVHVVGLMRRGFYPTYDANYVSLPYVIGIALICLAVGLLLLRRYHQELLSR